MDEHSRHWKDDEFLRRLYGLAAEQGTLAHLEACPDCRARWEQMQARRSEVLAAPRVSEEFLHAQRQAIWSRIDNRQRRPWLGWKATASATGLVVLLSVVLLNRPAVVAEDPLVEIAEIAAPQPASDTQFFEEIAAMASTPGPRAAEAVRSLFDGGGN